MPAQWLAQTSARNCELTVGSISQNKTHDSQHHPRSQKKNTTFIFIIISIIIKIISIIIKMIMVMSMIIVVIMADFFFS